MQLRWRPYYSSLPSVKMIFLCLERRGGVFTFDCQVDLTPSFSLFREFTDWCSLNFFFNSVINLTESVLKVPLSSFFPPFLLSPSSPPPIR